MFNRSFFRGRKPAKKQHNEENACGNEFPLAGVEGKGEQWQRRRFYLQLAIQVLRLAFDHWPFIATKFSELWDVMSMGWWS